MGSPEHLERHHFVGDTGTSRFERNGLVAYTSSFYRNVDIRDDFELRKVRRDIVELQVPVDAILFICADGFILSEGECAFKGRTGGLNCTLHSALIVPYC